MHGRRPRLRSLLALSIILLGTMGQAFPPTYSRSQYGPWIDADRDCQDTRVEVLVRDADADTVRFEGDRDCTVDFARWKDPYTGNFVTVPSGLDVDHMVPLKHAHQAGAWRWSKEQKQAYANDLGYRWHLLAVSASANRAKGDKGPDQWKPENRAFWCQYAQAWASVKFGWGLSSTEAERKPVREMLGTVCPRVRQQGPTAWNSTVGRALQESSADTPLEDPHRAMRSPSRPWHARCCA